MKGTKFNVLPLISLVFAIIIAIAIQSKCSDSQAKLAQLRYVTRKTSLADSLVEAIVKYRSEFSTWPTSSQELSKTKKQVTIHWPIAGDYNFKKTISTENISIVQAGIVDHKLRYRCEATDIQPFVIEVSLDETK